MNVTPIIIGQRYNCVCKVVSVSRNVISQILSYDEWDKGFKGTCSAAGTICTRCRSDKTCVFHPHEIISLVLDANTLGNFPKKSKKGVI